MHFYLDNPRESLELKAVCYYRAYRENAEHWQEVLQCVLQVKPNPEVNSSLTVKTSLGQEKTQLKGHLGTPIEWQGERGQQSVVHWVLKQTEDKNKPKGRFLHAVCESAVELLATGQCECCKFVWVQGEAGWKLIC